MTDFKKKKQKYSVEKEHPKVEVTREKNNEHFSKAESIIADEDTQKEKRPKVEVTPKQNDENPSKLETTVADEDTQKEETPSKERSGPEIEQLKVEKETRNVERKSETVPKDDSEDEDEGAIKQRRQRGRRRRGRKDTSKQIKELKEAEIDNRDARKSEIMAEVEESATKNEVDSKRYCIGRKAITDFGVGKTYTGKVVYVKPFGIFIDIGCHSDAFCHVSRLSDDYVESSNALFKEGDEVNPRVVEIDRRKKKITVSLQSEARLEDERASAQARQQRKNIRKPPSSTKKPNLSYSSRDTTEDPSAPKQSFAERKIQQPKPVASAPKRTLQPPDESTMTPAELKRARKLARRAARREETGGAGEAAQ
jgi:predicted RNA-binding protein with RPS1 domain